MREPIGYRDTLEWVREMNMLHLGGTACMNQLQAAQVCGKSPKWLRSHGLGKDISCEALAMTIARASSR